MYSRGVSVNGTVVLPFYDGVWGIGRATGFRLQQPKWSGNGM
jgi:hypothetical protein